MEHCPLHQGAIQTRLQVICNAELVFIDVTARWPGSVHDARVLRESALFRAFEQYPKPIEGVMLGDSGYMCRDWLFTPLANPVTAQEQRFHDALTKTRCTVERAIGVAKKRFHCLKGLRMQPPRACDVIVVCFMLSNRARAVSLEEDESDFESDNDDSDSDSSSSDSDAEPEPDQPNNATERQRAAAGKAARARMMQRYF